jgi:putative ABC transport system permease protein
MSGTLLLAWRYVVYHRWRSAVLAAGVALTLLLPASVQLLVGRYGDSLVRRAQRTALVLGAPGSRFDLVLDSLYFKGRTPRLLSMEMVAEVVDGGLGTPVPLYTARSAAGHPLVGTTPDYYALRELSAAQGELPLLMGECVLGARVARAEQLEVGDALLTDRERLYDLSAGYPLRMRVVGVLAESGSPDDSAVFCDLKTAWIAAGLGHGHDPAGQQAEERVLKTDPNGAIVLNAGVVEFTEITPRNVDDFHFHGGPAELPLTGVLVEPRSRKALTLLKGRFVGRDDVQALVPLEVMQELLGVVFRVKVFFDANALLVGLSTAMFLAVIVTLSLAVRRRERLTLFKLGCARATVARLMASELALVIGAGVLLALAGAAALVGLAARGIGPLG